MHVNQKHNKSKQTGHLLFEINGFVVSKKIRYGKLSRKFFDCILQQLTITFILMENLQRKQLITHDRTAPREG